jgi:hypothetical protein
VREVPPTAHEELENVVELRRIARVRLDQRLEQLLAGPVELRPVEALGKG